MKRIIFNLGALLIVTLSSCNKWDTVPQELVLESDVFDVTDKEGTQARAYLYGIYSLLPSGFNRIDGDFLDAATDDAVASSERSNITWFTNGQMNAANYPDNNWANCYTIIRRCNFFLKNIELVPLSEALITRHIGEARFLRAFAYFELLKRYGGIPLVGDKVLNLEDNIDIPRSTYEECVNYIAAEIDACKDMLPVGSQVVATEFGRANTEAALALKCRLFLYAASPLFNGGGISTNPQIRALNGYPVKDDTRWTKAILAAEELIAKTYYKLPAGSGTAAYQSVFLTKINTDIIFSKQSANSTSLENANAPVGYTTPAASNGRTSPTQEFLNAFPNLNGSAFTGSNTDLAQFTGRDPRLAATIFYNGVKWLGRSVETFEGGLDKPNRSFQVQTKTGYYLRKFLGDFANGTTYANQSHNFPYFRFAEVLLNYAEALNERGSVEDAAKQIFLIRARAGITAGSNSRYGVPAGINQTDLRKLIKNERRIELSFEEHRFWDIRRWKDAESIPARLTGLTLVKSGSTLTGTRTEVADFKFAPRNYYMPIPFGELQKNSRLIQNEGY